ncbi:glutamate--cysteine ligase [Aliiglaciecola sp. LCG003]|uniref:glutamate--cysteine ligase n=1 Tax=Aliiglaciecola sp. LCG003 TaxID=3053655 RepID=UPI0025739B65|nr:glutamate--cysteine ligase [Aliiglaciecola sp. LCG003]WJG08317.1 glutamate--cysteine ligase [Aliiglaciecola sp. LCG003]
MTSNTSSFAKRLAVFKRPQVLKTLPQIKHGVERETLRINPKGTLSQTPHPTKLGAALTHDYITTDFSESLLEFITPPESDIKVTLNQLGDVHKFVMENIGNERLWPMSMPCFIDGEEDIPIAQYGSSNAGKMKTLYRVGLKNRYGSMMQAIAGVHFNFSFGDGFWQVWLQEMEQQNADKDSISAAYFAMIRNYRRFCWLIPFLFGSSPAICGSFIRGKKTNLPFKLLGKGTHYLPYATSLRMSDLGYTNSEQSGLAICYNHVDSYINSLRKAINTPSEKYQKFAEKSNGAYRQLNANVLQIENELYSPIRPKQPTQPLEKPTDALAKRGVSYIEVRALDVNPFSPVGITEEQFYFLDVFLAYCLVAPSEMMDENQYAETERNLKAVVVNGRDPELRLHNHNEAVSLPQWSEQLFDEMREVAACLDQANNCQYYSAALEQQWQKICDPSLTPSAKILDILLQKNFDNGALGVELAEQYRSQLLTSDYALISQDMFNQQAIDSLAEQHRREQLDDVSFDQFLAEYFSSSVTN